MASMVFASSPLSPQSLVKLRTNSNYPHSSCFVPSPSNSNNSYVHLSYNKNISKILSSKSTFTKGDYGFPNSLPKISRTSSTLSPSFNNIKSSQENIYHFPAYDLEKDIPFLLEDRYKDKVLLIVNIPEQGSKVTDSEYMFLNELRQRYIGKTSDFGSDFEVLGFYYDNKQLGTEPNTGITVRPDFPIFGKIPLNLHHDKTDHEDLDLSRSIIKYIQDFFNKDDNKKIKYQDLWHFLKRNSEDKGDIKEEFEKFLVSGDGEYVERFPLYNNEKNQSQTVTPGGYPGSREETSYPPDPYPTIRKAIDAYFPEYRRKGN